MKLKKDVFKMSEIEKSSDKIINFLLEYISVNQLGAGLYDKNIYFMTESALERGAYRKIIDKKEFFKRHFVLFEKDTLKSSHNLFLPGAYLPLFYSELFKRLNTTEKIAFIKSSCSLLRPEPKILYQNLPEEDFWLHLRHASPFTKIRQPQRADNIRDTLEIINKLNIDTKEKVEALGYYFNYHKPLTKRIDIRTSLINFIKNKIDEQYFPFFEELLSFKIAKDSQASLLVATNEIKYLSISKEAIFEQVPLSKINQPKINNYNTYLNSINHFLLSPEVSKELNIEKIGFHEFHSTNEPARLYISSQKNGFPFDMSEIYPYLIKSCCHLFNPTNIDSIKEMKSGLKKSLDYLLLHQSISKENIENNITDTKKKTMKL